MQTATFKLVNITKQKQHAELGLQFNAVVNTMTIHHWHSNEAPSQP